MLSACGVKCSECPAYHGQARGIAYQTVVAGAWRTIYGLAEAPQRISCGGCLGPDDELFHTSRSCRARQCCLSHGFADCAECPAESCPDLERAQALWDEVPELAARLSPADFETYARPYCGHRQRLADRRAACRQ